MAVFIIVMTLCGIGPNGLVCMSTTPPQVFPALEACEIAVEVSETVIAANPPQNVNLHYVNGACLNIGVDA